MFYGKTATVLGIKDDKILKMMIALNKRCAREGQHSQRVGTLCLKLASNLGLSSQEQLEVRLAGLLHDIGKVSIDSKILNKPEELTSEEWFEMRQHPERGYRNLHSVTGMSKIADAVLSHHERWDGTGYPSGLRREYIPFTARIIAVADSYDAMISTRPYRAPLSRREALEELKQCAGKQFDSKIVKAFLECC